jgi:hypothetical protein
MKVARQRQGQLETRRVTRYREAVLQFQVSILFCDATRQFLRAVGLLLAPAVSGLCLVRSGQPNGTRPSSTP